MPILALTTWPLISLVLFAVMGPARGLIWSVSVGYLFLPEFTLNLPGLPGYGKREAIAIGALMGAAATAKRSPAPVSALPVRVMFRCLLTLLVLSPLITVMLNSRPIIIGPTVLTGLGLWDYQNILLPILAGIVPWLLARRFLHTPEYHRDLLAALVMLGLVYSLAVLFELRMSPQLNNMVYGFFPHSWIQHLRGGGFRPLVFLRHGLWLGFFLLMVVLAAAAMVRSKKENRAFYFVAAVWMMLVLMVSRNLGAAVLGLLFVACVFLSPKAQIRIAVIVAVLFTINPLVRSSYEQPLLALAEQASIHRANSLRTRFDNETLIYDHAMEKPVFGWGHRSRWRVHDERGEDITLSDGVWIIVMSQRGWVGFIAFFGLLILPVLLLRRVAKSRPVTPGTSALALMIGANLIYMIPNSTLSPIGWMVAGALAGFVQFVPAKDRAEDKEDDVSGQQAVPRRSSGPVYSRFSPDNRPERRT